MEELVEKAKKNNEEEFNLLILSVQKEMYLIAKSKLKNEEDIADAIQETIFSCYRNLKKLREPKFFKTWLIKILLNECNKIYKKRRKNHISYEEQEMEKYVTAQDNSLDNINFEILIRNLSNDEKLILTLYYYLGYSTKEISKIISLNENTIKSKMHRAKLKLKDQYEGGYYE